MTRPILIAGLLGGLLGGAVSFAASRWIVPAKSDPTGNSQTVVTPEARAVAEAFVDKLRAGKFEEFALDTKMGVGSTIMSEADFVAFKTKLLESRTVFMKSLGPSSGEFELVRAIGLGPSLAKFVYLEKFERGAVLWIMVLYHGTDDQWRIAFLDYGFNGAAFFSGLS